MCFNNGIAWEKRALDFFICGPNKKNKNVNYELKSALLGQNDLLKKETKKARLFLALPCSMTTEYRLTSLDDGVLSPNLHPSDMRRCGDRNGISLLSPID